MNKSVPILTAAVLATMFAMPVAHAETPMAHAKTKTARTTRGATTTTTTTRTFVKPMTTRRGFYVAGQAGYNIPTRDDDAFDENAVFAGALGYRFNPNFRVEGEAAYRKNDIDGDGVVFGDTKIADGMVNAYYDFSNRTPVTPYLGAGIGVAYGKLDADIPLLGASIDENDTTFAWQGIAGLAYDVMPRLALTADYRYFDTANFDDIGDDYSAHEIRAGLRYTF